MKKLIKKIENWFVDRDLHTLDGSGQLLKLDEEVGELFEGFEEDDTGLMIDAVGDITVVLIGFCLQVGLDFETCVEVAYEEIKNRKGKVINGVFVKEEDLPFDEKLDFYASEFMKEKEGRNDNFYIDDDIFIDDEGLFTGGFDEDDSDYDYEDDYEDDNYPEDSGNTIINIFI